MTIVALSLSRYSLDGTCHKKIHQSQDIAERPAKGSLTTGPEPAGESVGGGLHPGNIESEVPATTKLR